MSDGRRAAPGPAGGAPGHPHAVTEQRLAAALRTGDLATITDPDGYCLMVAQVGN